jgi:hypothetical protein
MERRSALSVELPAARAGKDCIVLAQPGAVHENPLRPARKIAAVKMGFR